MTMNKLRVYIPAIFLGALLVTNACQRDDYELGPLVAPGNVAVTYEILGADADNPFGDGTGAVNFTATADDEITFNYDFGDGKDNSIAPDGKVSHIFSKNGIHTYNVTVFAIGTGGISSVGNPDGGLDRFLILLFHIERDSQVIEKDSHVWL